MRIALVGLALMTCLVGCIGEARVVETRELGISADDVERLYVDVGAGNLLIAGVEGLDHVDVLVDLTAGREILADDEGALEALNVTFERDEEGAIRLEVTLDDAPVSYWADVRVWAPARMHVSVEDGSGDACVHDFAELDVVDGSGELIIRRIAGPLTVDDGSGGLHVDGAGPTRVDDGSGDIEIRNVAGPLEVEDGTGGLLIRDVVGTVSVEDGSGEMEVEHVDGDVHIIDGSGGIFVDDVAGRVTIDDGSGDILVGEVGELEVISDGSGELERI